MTVNQLLGVGLLAFAVMTTGCSPSAPPPGSGDAPTVATNPTIATMPSKNEDHHDDHDHGPGPHGGTIIEFGKYHAEFCVDHSKKEATIYILSGNLKKGVPVPVESMKLSIKSPQFEVDAKASPLEGEPQGKSSRFVAIHDNFGKVQEFEGTLIAEIEGKPYLGDFKEEAHKDEKK